MLSSAERPPRLPKLPIWHDIALAQYGNITQFPVDVVTISQFPSRAAHIKLQESVKPAANLIPTHPLHDDRTKRIMREVSLPCSVTPTQYLMMFLQLKALVADPHPQMDLYVNDNDITFLKIILEVDGQCVVSA
jgi:hypothetical protein